jgi:hypothetical protein
MADELYELRHEDGIGHLALKALASCVGGNEEMSRRFLLRKKLMDAVLELLESPDTTTNTEADAAFCAIGSTMASASAEVRGAVLTKYPGLIPALASWLERLSPGTSADAARDATARDEALESLLRALPWVYDEEHPDSLRALVRAVGSKETLLARLRTLIGERESESKLLPDTWESVGVLVRQIETLD